MTKNKFRAWDRDRMCFKKDLFSCWSSQIGKILSLGDIFNRDNIMQYTGLHDKNGKEIYEGDIVTQHLLRSEYFGEINSEIIYYQDECGFQIATISDDGRERHLTPLHKDIKLEIIGNIYEDAKLLNKEPEEMPQMKGTLEALDKLTNNN